ncbi:MAG: HD domain-containing protein [Lachnospiraceae bacterium]|nr:HD domain-containing protein [Lachnospiraceae bacterium]
MDVKYDVRRFRGRQQVGSKRKVRREHEDRLIDELLRDLKSHERVLEMKKYMQHGRITTFDHCESVAKLSYRINKRLHLNADEKVLLKAGMLHDFFLYDWHRDEDGTHPWHGYHHADKALENANKYFEMDEREKSVIWSHMWPLNITRFPKSKEAWIVCMADKMISCVETLFKR